MQKKIWVLPAQYSVLLMPCPIVTQKLRTRQEKKICLAALRHAALASDFIKEQGLGGVLKHELNSEIKRLNNVGSL
jgi:hypothetical protein